MFKNYFFGSKILTGGKVFNDGRTPECYYITISPIEYWHRLFLKLLPIHSVKFARRYHGVSLRINDRVFNFYWKPICPYFLDENSKLIKSKKFQFFTFSLLDRPITNKKKENTMTFTTEDKTPQENLRDAHGNPVTRTVVPNNDGKPVDPKPQFAVQENEQGEENKPHQHS